MRYVTSILPMLTLAAVIWLVFVVGTELWADKPDDKPAPAPASPGLELSADKLLADSVAQLDRYATISARVRQQVDLFNQHLVGSGVYLRKRGAYGRDLARFEMKMVLQDQVSTLLEVCDGNFVWSLRDFKNGDPVPPIDKVDVQRVLRAQPAPQQVETIPRLALGGYSRLLQSLRQGFQFHSVAEDGLGNLPVYRLEGTWKPAQLAAFLPEQKSAIEAGEEVDLTQMEPHVPDEVWVYLGAEDLFPYRVEFRRDGAAIVSCEVSELQVNVGIDPRQFQFDPGRDQQDVPDTTAQFLTRFGLTETPK